MAAGLLTLLVLLAFGGGFGPPCSAWAQAVEPVEASPATEPHHVDTPDVDMPDEDIPEQDAQTTFDGRTMSVYDQLDLLVDVRHEVVTHFVERPDETAMVEAAVRAMIESLDDPYTTYLSPQELEPFDKEVRGSFSGIGAEVRFDPDARRARIVSPLEDSPAWHAGVMAGDLSVASFVEALVPGPWTIAMLAIQLSGILECEQAEQVLAMKRDTRLCRSVGSYCSSRIPIIRVCIEKTESHCCFNSGKSSSENARSRRAITTFRSSAPITIARPRSCKKSLHQPFSST